MLAPPELAFALPGRLLLALTVVVAFALFGLQVRRLVRLLRLGGSAERRDRPGDRWRGFVRHVLGQGRLLRDPLAGGMHAVIFWGFLVITVSTVETFLAGLFPGFSFGPLTSNAIYVCLLDLFQTGVLGAVLLALYRRVVARVPRLAPTVDALVILGFIATLMATAILAQALRIAREPGPLDSWAPVSATLAAVVPRLPPPQAEALYAALWWAHVLTVLGFLVYVPRSKHLHVLTAPFNVWLRSLRPSGEIGSMDVEVALEQGRPLGASRIAHFTWKDFLDSYTCTECGRCDEACPATISGKALQPRKLILDLKHHLLTYGPGLLSANGGAGDEPEIVGGALSEEEIWDCTTCQACMRECPVFIEHVPKIVAMRRHLVMEAGRFGPELRRLFDNLEASGNPWRWPRGHRGEWARGLNVPTLAQRPAVDVLYWVGCAGSYDERNQRVARAFARLLQRAGVAFAILGAEETCTGDPARRAGNEYLFQRLARQNVETLDRYGVGRIVTTCPHCYNVLKNEYPHLGGRYHVVHHSQLLHELVEAGRLPVPQGPRRAVVYHDPCYLGRSNEIYDPPRAVLHGVPGVSLREVPRCHRDRALCCGAGGARVFMEERRGRPMNHVRLEQVLDAAPDAIATACPYCITMLEDGARAKDVYGVVPVADIAEILEGALEAAARDAPNLPDRRSGGPA